MGRRNPHSLYPGSSMSHLLCPRWLVMGVLLAALGCRAQTDTPVTIRIGNSNRSTAIIPDEISTIKIVTQLNINPVSFIPNILEPSEPSGCEDTTDCTLELTMSLGLGEELKVEIILQNSMINQTLVLTIREQLDATCQEYPVPMRFATGPYNFTCEPMALNGTDVEVRWRRFRLEANLTEFMERPESNTNFLDNTTDGITISNNGRNLTVDNAEANIVAYYYVPSFLMTGSNVEVVEVVTAETLIFVGPMILGDAPEFSREVELDDNTQFTCNTNTFPPATVNWTLISDEYPCTADMCGVNVAGLNGSFDILFEKSGDEANLTLSKQATLRLLNLQYDQDGAFTCMADNGESSSTRRFNLRVKSPLRALWPALGIISVFILVALLMLCSFVVEKIVERKKLQGYRSPLNSPDRNDQGTRSSSSQSGHSNSASRARNHTAVKRLSSNKPLIDESTL